MSIVLQTKLSFLIFHLVYRRVVWSEREQGFFPNKKLFIGAFYSNNSHTHKSVRSFPFLLLDFYYCMKYMDFKANFFRDSYEMTSLILGRKSCIDFKYL